MAAKKDLNAVIMIGRLTRDIEVRYTQAGTPIGEFSLAVNYTRKVGEVWEEHVSFFPAVVFGAIAENLAPYLIKGTKVSISGELRQERWEQEGEARSRIRILVSHIQLLGSPQQGATQQPGQQSQYPSKPRSHAEFSGSHKQSQSVPPRPQGSAYSGPEFFDDDIPF